MAGRIVLKKGAVAGRTATRGLDSLGVTCAVERRGFPFLVGLFGQPALKLLRYIRLGFPRCNRCTFIGNVLLSQVFPHVLDPPLAAHMGEPNQVQCWTLA